MRLFVHMPKCAGSSLKKVINSCSEEKLITDNDTLFTVPAKRRWKEITPYLQNPVHCDSDALVFGHFFPVKYLGNNLPKNLTLVTLLRDPVARMISHYNYWNAFEFRNHFLWRKMKEQNWSLADFIMSEELKNFYGQYLTGCPKEYFNYIGIYENYNKSAVECLKHLGFSSPENLSIPHENKTPENLTHNLTLNFLSEAEDFHSDDYDLYEYALRRFHT